MRDRGGTRTKPPKRQTKGATSLGAAVGNVGSAVEAAQASQALRSPIQPPRRTKPPSRQQKQEHAAVEQAMLHATRTGRALTPAESRRAVSKYGFLAANVLEMGLRSLAHERDVGSRQGSRLLGRVAPESLPYDSPQAERLRRAQQAALTSPASIDRLMRATPSLGSALDSLGQNTIGLGMVRPSRMPGNILHNLGLGAHGLPTDKRPESKFKRPLTTDEFNRYQRTGVPPLSAISAEPTIGMVPFIPGSVIRRLGGLRGRGADPAEAAAAAKQTEKAARAELAAHPYRQEIHAKIDRTVADKALAAKLQKQFDLETLTAAKHVGMRPGKFLEHLRSTEHVPAEPAAGPAAHADLARYRDLEKRVTAAEARVEAEHGPAKFPAGGTDWRAWSRKRGYTEKEIQEFDQWLSFNKRLGITEPDSLPTPDRPFGMSDEGILAASERARSGGQAAEAQVAGSLGHAGMLRTVQEQGYSHVRSERFGKAQSAFEQAGGGEAGLQAFYGEMAGELPKLGFTDLQHLSGTDELQHLINTVFDHPALTIGQKGRAAKALQNAVHNAVTPTTSEIRDLSKVFPPQDVNKIVHVAEQQQQHLGKLLDVLNIPRALQASFDVSGLFRQALTVLTRHPLVWAEAISPSVRAMKTSEQFDQHYASIVNDADYAAAKAAGVPFTHMGSPLGQEEQYSSRLAEMIPGVSHSARQYTAFLNELRLQLWKKLLPQTEKLALRQAARKGRDSEAALEKAHKDLARYIGSTTGRGPFPKKYAGSAALLNATFFSPRLLSSRFDLLLSPLTYAKASPYVRRQALQTMFHTVGLGIGVLMAASRIPGVTVSMNPTQADFGRIKIGDTRIDIWGGFQPLVRLFAGVAHDVAHRDTSYGAQTAYDRVLTFIRTKYAPNTSFVVDALAGQNVVGQPFRWQDQWQRVTPILAQDIVDVLQNRGSIPAAAGAAGLSALGLGVLTYPAHQAAVAGVKERDKWLSDVQKTLGSEWLPESTRRARQNEMLYAQAADKFKTDTYGTTQHALSKRDEATVLLNLAQQVMPAAVDQWGGAAKLGAFVQNASPLQIPHFISFWRKKMWEDRVNYVNKQMAAKRSYQEQKQWNASHGG